MIEGPSISERSQIAFILVAGRVERTPDGLLNISNGAGNTWLRRVRDGQALPSSFGIAGALRVPWSQRDHAHPLRIHIEDDEGAIIASLEVIAVASTLPPGVPPGTVRHVTFAATAQGVLPHPGGYRLVVQLTETGERKTWPFRVVDAPAPARGEGHT
jgi:hypothetical protein